MSEFLKPSQLGYTFFFFVVVRNLNLLLTFFFLFIGKEFRGVMECGVTRRVCRSSVGYAVTPAFFLAFFFFFLLSRESVVQTPRCLIPALEALSQRCVKALFLSHCTGCKELLQEQSHFLPQGAGHGSSDTETCRRGSRL